MKECVHKFQARYEEKWTTPAEKIVKKGQILEQVTDRMVTPYLEEKIYIYDICTRCGKIVKRI